MDAPRSEALLASLELFGIRLGLERTRRLLAGFGDPHLGRAAVLVAGTNGKGSTAALLEAICRAAGYRTGLYTSPHLESVSERVAVDGSPIGDDLLACYLEEVLALAGRQGEPPTYFEALTIAAFRRFRDAGVELAILEVGLGGRLDATNVAEPILSLVTPISRDHQEHLGSTLAAITREKCGILRRGRPAIAWTGDPEVEAALNDEAERVGCDLILARRSVRLAADRESPFTLETPERAYSLELALAGLHQRQNAALAVLAAEALAARGWSKIEPAAIGAGCRRCRWPGRLETVMLPGDRRVLLDAAHNPEGIAALVRWVETLPEPPDLLFGAMRDKAVGEMLPVIAAVCGRIVLSRARGARAGDPRAWQTLVSGKDVTVEDDLEQALERALGGIRGTLLVCGSIALVGEVRGLLRHRWGAPLG